MLRFNPSQVVKQLLAALPQRARDVLEKRYGLNKNGETFTLEAIGQIYGITRERVRQIENYGLQSIRKSEAFAQYADVFNELHGLIETYGAGVVPETLLFEELALRKHTRNQLFFLLTLGESFDRGKENAQYGHRWWTEKRIAAHVERALQKVYKSLQRDALVSEEEILNRFRNELIDIADRCDDTILKRWLLISKQIAANPLGEWGHANSPNVRVKGIRDYAYLVVKRHGSPMHFREVAAAIETLFGRKAHIATTHNELIKDERFVLVGRGLYALAEWGYSSGVVKDVLTELLATHGPMTRAELIERVRRERYVKDNTIVVNLQDSNLFKRLPGGLYALVDA